MKTIVRIMAAMIVVAVVGALIAPSFSVHSGAQLFADDADGLTYRTRLAFEDVHLVGFDENNTGQPFDIDTRGLSLSLTGLKTAPLMASRPLVGFLQRIVVKGKAFTDLELADWLISRSPQPAQARKALRQLIGQNLLVVHDGLISAQVYADIEALRINDQPMPPGMRQGLLGAIIGGAAALAAPSR